MIRFVVIRFIMSSMSKSFLFLWLLLTLATSLYGQSKRALLIGISDYKSFDYSTAWSNVNGVNDINLLSSTLVEQGFYLTTLLDSEATSSAIHRELNRLATTAEPGDIVYFHFSGHGQPVLDLDGDEGEKDGWDESIVPYDAAMFYEKGRYEGENHIIDDQLGSYFTLIRKAVGPTGMVYAVIDACYSGTGVRGEEDEEEGEQGEVEGEKQQEGEEGEDDEGEEGVAVDEDAPYRGVNVGFDYGTYTLYEPAVKRDSFYRLDPLPGAAHLVVLEACLPHQRNREIRVGARYYGPLSYYLNEVIKGHIITVQTAWIGDVRRLFAADKRTCKQQVVCESSIEGERGY